MPSPLARAGEGAIGSVVGLAPEFGMPVYGATKAFVLHLSQALSVQLGPQGVYVQAVLPAATCTEIWEHSGVDVDTLPGVMEVADLVDAALVGFDRREPVTIPPLQDAGQWDNFETARQTRFPASRSRGPPNAIWRTPEFAKANPIFRREKPTMTDTDLFSPYELDSAGPDGAVSGLASLGR